MGDGDLGVAILAGAAHELTLFASVGLLIGGVDDLLVDLIWLGRALWRRATVYRRHARTTVATLPPPSIPSRIAVLIGAWDESAVIGRMLASASQAWAGHDLLIYVATYPNDPATVDAVDAARARDPRIRAVPGVLAGPTTKAEALNRAFSALVVDEQAEGIPVRAIVLHDAEDIVHSAEPAIFAVLIDRFEMIQLPVLPLPDRGTPGVAMHYADEFAEAHGKQLVVREAIGAGLPSAGVGCAIARDALQRIADANGGLPFDADSLTEDYELGLRLRAAGGRGAFVAMRTRPGGPLVAVRAHFPATLEAAIAQKSRWIAGIALSGWDRLGWAGGLAERWMRARDRRAPLAAIILLAAWIAFAVTALAAVLGLLPPVDPTLQMLLAINALLLLWRLALRAALVARLHGLRQGLFSIPRMMVANAILIAAAWRAVGRYRRQRRDGRLDWGKTAHRFPDVVPAE